MDSLNFCIDIHDPQRMKPADFGDFFSRGLWFLVKCLSNDWTDSFEILYTDPGSPQDEFKMTLMISKCFIQHHRWVKLSNTS